MSGLPSVPLRRWLLALLLLLPGQLRAHFTFTTNNGALTLTRYSASVTNIGRDAFANATRVTNIGIPNAVTSIGVQALFLCSNLRSVSIPDGDTSIGWYTFLRCSRLTNLHLGRGQPFPNPRR